MAKANANPNANDDRPRKAFAFLHARALDGRAFSLDELRAATGYDASALHAYRANEWQELLVDDGDGLRVRRELLRLTERQFVEHLAPRGPLLAHHERRVHAGVLSFEFLLPLTREAQLRAALEHLFFRDTILERNREIGLRPFEALLPREDAEPDDAYLARAVEHANKFFGYSITHVSGRYRASSELLTRVDAAALAAGGAPYLVDETSAIVRFILPLQTAARPFADSLSMPDDLDDPDEVDEAALVEEARALRTLFFLLFAEAIVRTVKGEDEIWLLERGLGRDRLYVWSRVTT